MQIYSKSDIGKVRTSNQDSFYAGKIDSDTALAVVCDGMGGANAGNVASEIATKQITDYILRSYSAGMSEERTEKLLKSAIENANMEIFDKASKDESLSGMGTTAVVVLVKGGNAVIAHVGDSRAYLAGEELIQLTRDHSVVQSLIESGKITPEDAKTHPRKNVITRALGAEEKVVVDFTSSPIIEGQTLLLCTDGLSGFADSDAILKTVKAYGCEEVPQKLIELANNNGGGDNITVVTVTV